jgi:acyl-CoA reductase-like NAD-dependent aldehyde dehydrogenase
MRRSGDEVVVSGEGAIDPHWRSCRRATALGPVIRKQMKAFDYVEIGQRRARVDDRQKRVGDRGYFISPAVFANVSMRCIAG